MALTAAERQRRHREKLRAEGRLPKSRRTLVNVSAVKTPGRKPHQQAAERQWRGRQRLPAGQDLLLGPPPPEEVGNTEQAPLMVLKAEPDAGLDSNDDMVLDHDLEVGLVLLKHRPEMQSETAGMFAGETSDAVRDCQEATGEVAMGQSGSRALEEVTQENSSLQHVQPRLEVEDGHDETRDLGGATLSSGTEALYVYEAGNSAGSSLDYDAFLEQQKILRKRWFAAERQRKRRSRLRAEGKYQEYRQKHNVISGRNRAKQKDLEKALPDDMRRDCLAKRREDTRLRVARYRERKKWMLSKDELQGMVPAEINSDELVQQQPSSVIARHQYSTAKRDLLGQPTSNLELQQGAEDNILASSLPLSSCVLPYSLQKLDCHQTITTTSASTSGDPGHYEEPDSAREEIRSLLADNKRGRQEEENMTSSGPVMDHQAPHCYVTPPVWPCNRRFQIRQDPSRVTHMSPDKSSERRGTRQEMNSQECPKDATSVRVRNSLTHLQTRPSQSLADLSGSDSVHIKLVTEFDQDHPYRTDGSLRSMDCADMPDDLRNELYGLRHQSPLVHNYIKKLQTDIMNLQAKNQQLRKQTLCLDEIKANNSMFHFWSGFPSYESFRCLFEALKVVVEPATCPHSTLAPTLEEEFFYVRARIS